MLIIFSCLSRYNKKGKEKDLQVVLQGIDLPQPSMSGTGAPQPKEKPAAFRVRHGETFLFPDPPDTAGMAKLKRPRQQQSTTLPGFPIHFRPVLPSTAQQQTAVTPVAVRPSPSPVPILPSSSPVFRLQTVPPFSEGRPEGKDGAPKRKYRKKTTVVRCSQCGEERVPPVHQQYMGYRYCGKTQGVPFEEWRRNLQSQGVARKRTITQ